MHFIAAALQLMRWEYLDYLKRHYAGIQVGHLGNADPAQKGVDLDRIEAVSRILDELETHDPMMAEVMVLSEVRGWSMDRIAEVTGVAKRTLERAKQSALEWLREHPDSRGLM